MSTADNWQQAADNANQPTPALGHLENRISAIEAHSNQTLRHDVAARYGLTPEDADLFLTATTEEDLSIQAAALAERLNRPAPPAPAKKPGPVLAQYERTGGGVLSQYDRSSHGNSPLERVVHQQNHLDQQDTEPERRFLRHLFNRDN